MDRESIIRMAREAGFVVDEKAQQHQPNCIFHTHHMVDELLEAFAALVAAHVRETEFKPDWNNYRQGLADGADEEREACAKVCEDVAWEGPWKEAALNRAAAIRARWQA